MSGWGGEDGREASFVVFDNLWVVPPLSFS